MFLVLLLALKVAERDTGVNHERPLTPQDKFPTP